MSQRLWQRTDEWMEEADEKKQAQQCSVHICLVCDGTDNIFY